MFDYERPGEAPAEQTFRFTQAAQRGRSQCEMFPQDLLTESTAVQIRIAIAILEQSLPSYLTLCELSRLAHLDHPRMLDHFTRGAIYSDVHDFFHTSKFVIRFLSRTFDTPP